MEVKTDISDIYELERETWSGGHTTVHDILELDRENNTDYGERLFQHLEEVFMFDEETPSLTTVNDYLWFDTETIYEAIGLNSDGEIPTSVDEAREENTTWSTDYEGIVKMGASELFSPEFLEFLKDELVEDEDSNGDKIYDMESLVYFDFEDLDHNHKDEITEEQIDFLNDNY